MVDGSTATVAVVDEPGETGLGAKLTLIPCGSPDAAIDTDGPAFPTELTEMATVPDDPRLNDSEPGEGVMEKSDPGTASKVMFVTGWISIPLGATPRCP